MGECESMTGIYIITNTITNEIYIGQSVNINNRFKQHKESINNKKYTLYSDMRFYGINSFRFEVLEECNKDSLNTREMYWIKHYLNKNYKLYNIIGVPSKEATYGKRKSYKRASSRKFKKYGRNS